MNLVSVSFERDVAGVQIVRNNIVFYSSLLLLECLFWGIGNPAVKIVLRDISPFYCLSIRFIMAFLIFMALFGKRFAREMRRSYLFPGIVVSFFTALSFATSNIALMYTSSTIVGFLIALAVIFTPLLARILLGSRVNPFLILPITTVVLGMYYLCGAGGAFSFGAGEFYALLSSVAGAFMLVVSSRYLTGDMNPFVISVLQTGLIGIYCLPLALFFEDAPNLSAITFSAWLWIFYLAAACSCVAYIIQNSALRKVPSTQVALIFCSEPLFTAGASYFMLGETLNGAGVFGAALITLSIVAASLIPEEFNYRSTPLRIGRIRIKKAMRHVKRNR